MLNFFKTIFNKKKYLSLVIFSAVSSFLLIISSQLEMISLGFIGAIANGKHYTAKTSVLNEKFIYKISSNFDLYNYKNLVILLIFLALFRASSIFVNKFLNKILSINISKDIRERYYNHIQSMSMQFYDNNEVGKLSSRILVDSEYIANATNSILINYIQTPFNCITTFLGCFFISWKLSIVTFFVLPIFIFPIKFLSKKIKEITKKLQLQQEKFTSSMVDNFSGIETVKLFGMEEYSKNIYKNDNENIANVERKSSKYETLARPILHVMGGLCLIVTAVCGLFLFDLSFPELLMFGGLLNLFYEPIKTFAEENAIIQKGVAASDRLNQTLNITNKNTYGDIEKNSFYNEIIFDKVSFGYSDKYIIKDLSFKIKKGEIVAIVGPTGSGKSTIIKLLSKLYLVNEGDIFIDSIPINKLSNKSINKLFSVVQQKPFLFLDTIAKNISHGKNIELSKIKEYAKLANISDFIESLPNKYDTLVLEKGNNFSGGQVQRLSIARALAKESNILIMDEATSSLDTNSEKNIQETILSLKGEKTQIIIAHRLSTIKVADKIIYLDNGNLIAEGSFSYMKDNCANFKELLKNGDLG